MNPIIYVSEDIALDFSMKHNFSPTVTVEELVETMKAHGYKVILSFVHPAVGRIVKMERSMQ